MKLRSISIKNFKSLQNITRKNISDFHTFIGRNSLGKSTIFEAINLIKRYHDVLTNAHELVSGSITDYEQKSISVDLIFDIDDEHRREYFAHYFRVEENQLGEYLDSNAVTQVRIVITINVYGDKITERINPNQILVSYVDINDTLGNSLILLQRIGDARNIRIKPIPSAQGRIHVNSDIAHYLQSFPHQDNESNTPLHPGWLPSRIISDIMTSLKEISAMRESTKKVPIQTIENEAQVNQRGTNLLNLMDTMFTNQNKRYLEVEEFCTRIFPDLESVRPKRLPNNEIILVLKKKNLPYAINLQEEGAGLDQLLIIMWRIATSNSNTIWMLDEPELHLHPGAEKLLHDFLREEVERDKQILVATHSMVFMYKNPFDDITILLPNEGFTTMAPLSNLIQAETQSRNTAYEDARDILYRALGYDPAFALEPKTVVMVEGKADELVIKEFAKILDRKPDTKSVFFIPIGNKNKVEQFGPILTYALSGKNSIIILDNDNEDPEEVKQKVLNHAKTFQKTSRIDKEILTEDNFCLYPKEVYSIESYLLKSEAIALAGGDPSKTKEIEDKILIEISKSLEHRKKPKDFLSNLWESIGFGPYLETDTAAKIASRIKKHQLVSHSEIVELIHKIYD
jgi:predicted ATP-dependent endonuclease of OLD family